MYQAKNQALLQDILHHHRDLVGRKNLAIFYQRLGASFYSIQQRFYQLYGERDDVEHQLGRLVKTLAESYIKRPVSLRQTDAKREQDPDWFLSQQWVGMAMYSDRFAGGLAGVNDKVSYLQELGVNMLHIMPMMASPDGANDGGYAVSDFRQVNPHLGNLGDIATLSKTLRKNNMLLTLDIVVNHTSDEHEWAQQARQGNKRYQDYYYHYPDSVIPDQFEQSMPEIFPETSPGNFTWDEDLQQWVMTVFNHYQWDLNYTNPAVFIEMIDIILYWANQGVDILRIDAPAFIWKTLGTSCQNLPNAHCILQLFKDCMQVVSPATLCIAEAIVAPDEIVKYFGSGKPGGRECEIAYNATFMALLWDAVATQNTKVLNQALQQLPAKPQQTTWLNYVRCHDDIGLGFENRDIAAAGFDPIAHRRFLVNYLTQQHPGSSAKGLVFAANDKTGDARISGSLASLVGLEHAINMQDEAQIQTAIQRIITLHALIMSYGGIALLYYGDELGTLNDYSYEQEPDKATDNRWVHRPIMDWQQAEQRHKQGTVEQRVFSALQKLIALRKQIAVFADHNNRQLLHNDNQHLLTFARTPTHYDETSIVVVANFANQAHHLNLNSLRQQGYCQQQVFHDMYSDTTVPVINQHIISIPAYGFYWLSV